MNQQDQQAIDELFRHLYASASQAGPRDPQAEARIQQLFQQGPPGLLYQMAQTLVAQQHALNQARAQLAQPPDGAPAGFAPGGQGQAGGVGQAGGANAGYAAPAPVYQRSAGGGFLAGAGKIALGVGGGILAADAISSLFDGGGLFGGDRDYNNQTEIINNNYYDQPDGGQQDYAGQQDYGNQQDYGQQADYTDYGNQDDFGGQDFGSGQDFDDGGGW